jgi:hypothetical protein
LGRSILYWYYPNFYREVGEETADFHHNIACFMLGFSISTVMVFALLWSQYTWRLLPNARLQGITALVGASCGLLAQHLFCQFLNFGHAVRAHFGAACAVVAVSVLLEEFLRRRWFARNARVASTPLTRVN